MYRAVWTTVTSVRNKIVVGFGKGQLLTLQLGIRLLVVLAAAEHDDPHLAQVLRARLLALGLERGGGEGWVSACGELVRLVAC